MISIAAISLRHDGIQVSPTCEFNGNQTPISNVVAPRFWSSDLPAGAIVDTPFDFAVTSPVLTLLMVSPYVSIVHLALLIYEFVGTFTVFAPSPELEEIYREAIGGIRRISLDDWHRVACDVIAKERGIAAGRSGSAAGSDLWSRPALLTLDELDAFIEANAGMHGIKNLALARRYVTGVTASPFEARASVLLASSRALGGAGFAGVRNNVRIDLDADARKICGSSYVKGDLVWSARAGRPLTILECQGAMVHGGWGAAAADDDRVLALENMGAKVVRITYRQISEERRCEILTSHLAEILGVRRRTIGFGSSARRSAAAHG